ncbi:outer membrane beta-barrel protein [Lysobacter solisilvae (ex Woo and Kim 2020)]|uniref:Outer membrane beta-barrel protein n=1 Tax=Agrilutibacter terrestris TaxID=2865112 RepID=A0A7H0G0S4_9GAMM|nr:outer membrane beta-barrel protein [Lysobacter terrestris]QNP41890.1 outer membrane beta-barrel protein [Lysobacter terrestris]
MRKTKLLSTLLLSATLGAAAFGANAQDKGFYAGAGVGQSFVDEGAYDDEDTAFSVFGGYQFNRYFGLEAGYADFGKIEPDVTGPALEGDTAYFTAVGTLPITDKFAAYAKAGLHRWNVDTSLPGLVGGDDDSGTDPTYGVGLQYRFTDKVALRGEYSRFEIEDADADLAQLQVRFDF